MMLFANQRHHYYHMERHSKINLLKFFLNLVMNIQHLQFVKPLNLYWN